MLTAPQKNSIPQQSSLASLYASAFATYSELQELEYDEGKVSTAIACLVTCQAIISSSAMFSANETLDDIHSGDLKYLGLEAILGHLVLFLREGDRHRILLVAKNHFDTFLRTMEHLGIQAATLSGTSAAPSLRDQKIQAYKRQKELKNRVLELESLQRSLSHEVETSGGSCGGDLDEVERRLALAQFEQQIMLVRDSLSMIERECEMIKFSTKREVAKMDGTEGTARIDAQLASLSTHPSAPFLTRDGKVRGNFVLTSKREEVRGKVFGYGHNLPTMTIDEYLDMEMEQGNIISGGGKMPEQVILDEDDMAAVDAATYKARQWDEFKDDNPRGWGNRYNRS